MSSKRDYVAEILQKRSRLKRRSDAYQQFTERLHPVVAGFRKIKGIKTDEPYRKELLKYGPIGYVACVEGYYRLIVKDLIDSGSPYLEAAASLDDVKISISTVVAIQSQKFTLGEYVAHMISLNSLEDIDRCFSVLLGCSFLRELKQFDISHRGDGKILTMEEVHPGVFAEVQELFRLRNIYAHELATSEPVKPRHIEKCISAMALFVTSADEYLKKKRQN
jgi:hypothetical protein